MGCPSFRPSFHHNYVSAQYLENKLIEFRQILYNVFILTRSTLGLLHIIFPIIEPELWPLIYAKISFPFNILSTNGYNFTKFILLHILNICTRIMALDLRQNFVSTQYLENRFTEIHKNFVSPQYENKWTYLTKLYITFYTDKN